METLTVQVGSFEVNSTLIANGRRAVVVDPGQEGERIVKLAAERNWEIVGVVLTHAHFDHIGAIPQLEAQLGPVPVMVAAADAVMFGHPLNCYPPDYPSIARPQKVVTAAAGEVTLANGLKLRAIATPGHTPGGMCYFVEADGERPLLFSGDTLFAGSIGRTDLPGGDMARLMNSLEALKALPGVTQVIPGHGPFTTIAEELERNPFLQ